MDAPKHTHWSLVITNVKGKLNTALDLPSDYRNIFVRPFQLNFYHFLSCRMDTNN